MATYKPAPNFFRELSVSPEIAEAVRAVAEDGKAIAVEIAERFRVTGEYADSFDVDVERIEWRGEYPGPRVAGRLTNTAPYAAAVEWGKGGRSGDETESAHRVLGRTLDALVTRNE